MSIAVKPQNLRRKIATVGAVIVLTGGSAGFLVAGAAAQDSPTGARGVASGFQPTKVALPHNKLPRGAVRASRPLPALGAHGPAFASSTKAQGVTPNVVGGTLANAADFPWIVGIHTEFLAFDENNVIQVFLLTCTGTVISPTKVLTAGHCDTDLPFGVTQVIAGRNNLDDNTSGFVARVSSTWTHQAFNLAALNNGTASAPVDDVAVLTLQQPLPSAYTPITLTAQGDLTPYTPGTNATIVGYGVTGSGARDPGVLHQATVPIQSDATCAAAMGVDYDPTRMTCAGLPAGGVDTCGGDSGGPLVVNGVETAITDWGPAICAAAGTFSVFERLSTYSNDIKADFSRAPVVNLDWTGDGHSDLLARDVAGNLLEYPGSGFVNDGFGGFAGSGIISSGWNGYAKLLRVPNWNGDGLPSIMAKDVAGNLFQYKSDGAGGFGNGGQRIQIGNGWNVFTDIMVVNNWTGDGQPDIMGRTATGDLFLYISDGHGGWKNGGIGQQIGHGWNGFNTVLTPGIWTGGTSQSLIGRTPSGDLFLYESDGQGGWLHNGFGIKIGNGWNAFTTFFSPGDWNGDNMIDVVGVTPAGVMLLYMTDGHGNWQFNGTGRQIGVGWNGFTAIF